MPDVERDEAMGRLGGPSKLQELQLEIQKLNERLVEAEKRLQEGVHAAQIRVGSKLFWLPDLGFHSDSGAYKLGSSISGPVIVEGLGYDWVVVRAADSTAYWAANGGFDIRQNLRDCV